MNSWPRGRYNWRCRRPRRQWIGPADGWGRRGSRSSGLARSSRPRRSGAGCRRSGWNSARRRGSRRNRCGSSRSGRNRRWRGGLRLRRGRNSRRLRRRRNGHWRRRNCDRSCCHRRRCDWSHWRRRSGGWRNWRCNRRRRSGRPHTRGFGRRIFRGFIRNGFGFGRSLSIGHLPKMFFDFFRGGYVDRTRMRLLLGDAGFRQII